jgi:flagellar assembly protein FliH
MSRAHSSFIPAEQVENATDWNFSAVDQAALRFAAKLKAQAIQEELARDDSARKSGYSEGYAAGFEQGHAQATLEGQKQISDYIATQGQEAAAKFLQLFVTAQAQLEATEQSIAKGVLELACEVARQVLRTELSINPNVLPPVVREALSMLTADTKAASVRLNPMDIDVLAEEIQREFPNLVLNLVPDASMTPGGCLVEAAGTVIDGTVERRWTKALAVLGLDSVWEAPLEVSDD